MFNCLNCDTLRKNQKNGCNKYCNNKCQREFEYIERIVQWLKGNDRGWACATRQLKPYIRRYLFETRGAKCECCGWDKVHPVDGRTLVEIDHIDGNAENCRPENLKILCPNCHAMTPTHRARNKNSKRNRKGATNISDTFLIEKMKSEKVEKILKDIKISNVKRIKYPEPQVLLDRVNASSYLKVAREIGCSDNAIRRHLRKHNLLK